MDKHGNDALCKIGGPAEAARLLNITVQAVCQWQRIPVQHVLTIEAKSGVSRHLLRPDIYGPMPRERR